MPGPPTPVSSCPLVYLEIRNEALARAYTSSHPHSIFSLTIEGERPIDAETGTLILIINKGKQQMVSLRLNEIRGRGSQPSDDIVSINKQANRMCIRGLDKSQAILAEFEEKRDFSVAVCLLQKAGFYPSERIPTSLINPPPAAPQRLETSFDPKARLSSIVSSSSLPWNPQGAVAQPDLSFTAMLSAPFQPPTLSSIPTSHIAHTQGTSSVPMQYYPSANRMADAVPVATQLNPYNMFLERDSMRSHAPRVGSPLRYSLDSSPSPIQSPNYDYDARASENVLTAGFMDQSHVVYNSSGVDTSECSQNIAVSSYKLDRNLRKEFASESYNNQSPHGGTHNFRNLMPRPRKLPFDSSTKMTTSDGSPGVAGSIPAENVEFLDSRQPGGRLGRPLRSAFVNSRKVPTTDSPNSTTNIGPSQPVTRRVSSRNIDIDSKGAGELGGQAQDTGSAAMRASGKSNSEAYRDAECQTELLECQNTSDTSMKYPVIKEEHSDMDISALAMLTDCNTLQDLDHVTATLFEQYEKDIADGDDEALYAQFYLDQLWKKRRDFWFDRFKGTASG